MDQDQRLLQILDKILARLDNLESQIISMNEKLTTLETSATAMDSHINLVEDVYRQVRAPVSSLLNWTTQFASIAEISNFCTGQVSLPEIKAEPMTINEDQNEHMS